MDLDERAMENERRLNDLAQTVAITRETNRMNEKFQERIEEKVSALSDGQHQIVAQQAKISDKVDSATAAITTMRAELDARKEEAITARTKEKMWGLFAQLSTSTVAISAVVAFCKYMGWIL